MLATANLFDVEAQERDDKLALRNFERQLWNAEHTYKSSRGELKTMIREGELECSNVLDSSRYVGRIGRQKQCCEYWQKEIDKIRGSIFKHCLKTGLNSERGWSH